MKKVNYFSHDFGARNDPKLQEVLMEHGVAGIGIYWCIIEQLYEQDGEIAVDKLRSIAFTLHAEYSVAESLTRQFGLFYIKDGKIRSHSVDARLKLRSEIANKMRGNAQKRWNSNAIASKNDTTASKPNAIASKNDANKIKESKVNENKDSPKVESKGGTGGKDTPKSHTRRKKQPEVMYFVESEYREPFELWLQYKRERKESYKSDTSVKICYNRLKKLAGNDAAVAMLIVEQSIANNWQGLFELKQTHNGNSANRHDDRNLAAKLDMLRDAIRLNHAQAGDDADIPF